jgi:hypothetical protein
MAATPKPRTQFVVGSETGSKFFYGCFAKE